MSPARLLAHWPGGCGKGVGGLKGARVGGREGGKRPGPSCGKPRPGVEEARQHRRGVLKIGVKGE